jgi:hypothetical protein
MKWKDTQMRKYIDISAAKKLRLLNDHSLFVGAEWTHLDQTKWCLHCDKEFSGHSVRVYEEGGQVWLECGTPGCDGSPIDWANEPWWRGPKKKRVTKKRTPKKR